MRLDISEQVDKSREQKDFEKGISIEACIKKADACIKRNGMCLFVLDLKDSKQFRQMMNIGGLLDGIAEELNVLFEDYLPENNLAAVSRTDKGFERILGDAIIAGISSSSVIEGAVQHITQNYSELSFHYNVAIDGHDKKAIETIK